MESNQLKPIRILVDSLADVDLPNAQMGNAREIVSRLDPVRFHVSMFVLREWFLASGGLIVKVIFFVRDGVLHWAASSEGN